MSDFSETFDLVDADAPVPSESETAFYRLMDETAERIAQLARDQGLTQTALAEKVGKSKSYVSRVFSGGVNLTLRTIAEFEVALDAEVLTFPTVAPEHPVPRRGVPFAQVKEEWVAAQEASTAEDARLAALEAREEAVRQREVAVAAREKAAREGNGRTPAAATLQLLKGAEVKEALEALAGLRALAGQLESYGWLSSVLTAHRSAQLETQTVKLLHGHAVRFDPEPLGMGPLCYQKPARLPASPAKRPALLSAASTEAAFVTVDEVLAGSAFDSSVSENEQYA